MPRVLILVLAVYAGVLCAPAMAQDSGGTSPAHLQESILLEQQRAEERQEEVEALEQTEAELRRELSSIESRIKTLTERIAHHEALLADIREEEARVQEQFVVLSEERDKVVEELRGLLRTIWPVHLQNVQDRFQGVETWDDADRRFTWLSDIYTTTEDKFKEAQRAAARIEGNLARQRELASQAEVQLARVNALKDDLLRDKLTLRRRLGSVRAERQDIEAELQDILTAIQELNYQLNLHQNRRITLHQHALPWPARGQVVARFNENADPPIHGLGLSLGAGEDVRAVFWGKVVHAETLRGFGKVVIVYHGYDYYSLYAFLSETSVHTGQEVEKDEVLGTCGFYPAADGPGLYFELRFHQKPINPNLWLTSAP